MANNKQSSPAVYWIEIAIGIFFMFIFGRVVPPVGTITPMGMQILGVFIGIMFYLTVFESDKSWTALMAIPAVVFTGYTTTPGFIGTMLGNPTIFQMMMLMALCYVIRESGAGKIIATWFITRRFLKGRPVLFCGVFLWAFLIGSIFLGGYAFLLAWDILGNIFNSTGYKKREKFPILMICATYMIAWIGSSCIPIQGLPLSMVASFNGIMSVYGIELNLPVYMLSGLAVGTVVCFVEAFAFKYVFRADMSKIADIDPEQMGIDVKSLRFNSRQLLLLAGYIVGVGFSVVSGIVPKESAVGQFMSTITLYGWFASILIVLSIIRVKGQPVLNLGQSLSKGVMWATVLCTGAFLIIGQGITAKPCGIKEAINSVLTPLFGDMSFVLFASIPIFITLFVTNFMSNLATGVIVITIISPFIVETFSYVNPSVMGCAIIVTAMIGMLTICFGH